jgi:3-hydroxyisobutyrate dehydrogenase-like beta-hydroxyacid dehydrogenase
MKRRALLTSAAAGTAVIGLAATAISTEKVERLRDAAQDLGAPIVAYVTDAAKGEVVVMVGASEVVRRDAALVARLTAIAKEARDVVSS